MKRSIILIDDDQTFRDVMARSLSRLECEVETFEHPKDALSALEEIANPIVFLDLKLDADSGLRWISQLRSANPKSKIILLTGYASISTAVEAIKLGADDYLAKPINARQLLEHLEGKNSGENTPISENPMSVDRLEWEHIQKVLLENDGNISATARALGMHRRTLQRKLAKKPARS